MKSARLRQCDLVLSVFLVPQNNARRAAQYAEPVIGCAFARPGGYCALRSSATKISSASVDRMSGAIYVSFTSALLPRHRSRILRSLSSGGASRRPVGSCGLLAVGQ